MTSIVTVCTGNICRSPAAELLLARALGPDAVVTSAGTHALVGHGIPTPMLRCLDADGLDGRGHAARQFSSAIAASADVVVCMTARHRAWAVKEAPSAFKRTFLLSEVAAAARAGVPLTGGVAGISDAVQGYRVALAGVPLADVPDPYMESQDAYDRSYAMIAELVGEIGDWVSAASGR